MSVAAEIEKYRDFDFAGYLARVRDVDIARILKKDRLTPLDYLALLSPAGERNLEAAAQKARRVTIQQFGKVMFLFTPIYLANYCENHCVYCGFNANNRLKRSKLTMEELEAEAKVIADSGLKHVLILTGESPAQSPVSYMIECARVLKKYFHSIGLEVYPLSVDEYQELAAAGVDCFTMFQEVYDPVLYAELHPAGPKRDYRYRLDAPERACRAGMRSVNLGALLGLDDWRREAFMTGLHAYYLQHRYPGVELAVSMPRMRPHAGGYPPKVTVTDANIVQYIVAYRLFMPRAGITVSSRERAPLRDRLVQLGVTKMSAGASTAVGGRTRREEVGQFDISDSRGAPAMAAMLYEAGYQPVYKDWQALW